MILRSLILLMSTVSAPALAQQPPVAEPDGGVAATEPPSDTEGEDEEGAEVVVTGARERGSVPGDIQPELQLRPGDIRSYGVSNIAELLTELEPQTTSGRGREGGRPVVLLNGRRISGFGEIRDIPTEAIERVDILPEEAALRLGYRADQRVVNFVLRRRFNAITAEAEASGATAGGRYTGEVDGNLLRINRDTRLSVALHYDAADPLYENDRNIVPTPPSSPYAIDGNVTPANGAAEIDPALSAIAGRPVTAAGVPVGATGRPALSAFTIAPYPSQFSAYRTIAAATSKASANATYSRTIFGNISASLNGSFEATTSNSDLGLASTSYIVPAGNPYSPFGQAVTVNRYLLDAGTRRRDVDGNVAHVGIALNGDLGDWRWSMTGNYDRSFSRTWTDNALDLSPLSSRILAGDPAVNPFGRFDPGLLGDFRQDYARSITNTANYEAVASGPLLRIPAGNISTSMKAGFETNSFDARAIRSGVASSSGLGRDVGSLQASVDVPLASRRNGFLPALGNLSINGNLAVDQLSDFGRLVTYGYGANWSPFDGLRILASLTDEDGPPSVSQLGNPVVVTPDARIFDFVRGESVDVTQIDGGNRALLADSKRTMKLSLNLKPIKSTDLSLNINYLNTRIDDPISSLPAPTAEIEAAFPERFTRDATGQLIRFDNRPINFVRRDQQQIRWGINFSQRLGAPPPRPEGGFRRQFERPPGGETPPPTAEGQPQQTPPASQPGTERSGEQRNFGGPGGGRGGFGGRGGGGGFGGTRLQFSLYHTWSLEDQILVRPGLPVIDLLDGGATGSRGGQSAHQVSLDAGVTHNWLGVRVQGRWQSGTFVRGGTARAPTDLFFAPQTTVNLRLFANLTPNLTVVREHRWLRGMRVSLDVRNLFDQKLRVTDAAGNVPLNYQPDLLDPTGRVIEISVRKLFF